MDSTNPTGVDNPERRRRGAATALSRHYRAVRELSPKAARLASRLLGGVAGVSFEWHLALRVALDERAREAPPLTTSDLLPLPAGRRAAGQSSPPRDQASAFLLALERDSGVRSDAPGEGAPLGGDAGTSGTTAREPEG